MIKKYLAGVAAAVCAICTFSSCGNYTVFDTTYYFGEAIISLPDGSVVSGTVTTWCDYSDSDQIQVTIDGVTYLAHSTDVVLISKTQA